MADNKKSFLLYADLIHTIKKLPDENAGILFKLILEYVNDLNPNIDSFDILTQVTFEPIKLQLKRDLKRWEEKQIQRIEAGRRSAENRKQKLTETNETKHPSTTVEHPSTVNVTVTDTVNVTDIVLSKDNDSINEKDSKFNFKKELIALGISNQVASDWLKVRAKKKAANTETAFNSIKKEILKSPFPANESITIAVEKNWQGFKAEWLTNLQNQSNGTKENFRTDAKQYSVAANVKVINASD